MKGSIMKKFLAVLSIAVMAACAPKAPSSDVFVEPVTFAEMGARAEAAGGPGSEGYMWAVGSGPTEDQAGVKRPYSCFAIVFGEQKQFPCPAE